ncbi:MAG: ribosome-binding factor [Blastocatellia bacterium]|nr:ribosome-binding factor [Blastocatellia bacterium]
MKIGAGGRGSRQEMSSRTLAPVSCRLPLLLPTDMRRPERVADTLREEITQIVGYELEDPRVAMVTVTDVRVSDDLRDASVYVTVAGDEAESLTAMRALRKAAPYVRRQLGFALSLRHTPELHFVRDTIEEQGARVDELLHTLESQRAVEGKEE